MRLFKAREATAFPPPPLRRLSVLAKAFNRKERGDQPRRAPRKSSLASRARVFPWAQGGRKLLPIIEVLGGRCLRAAALSRGLREKNLKTQRTWRGAAEGAGDLPFEACTCEPLFKVLCGQCVFEKSATPTSTKRPLDFGNCGATASCSDFCCGFAPGESSFSEESACWAAGCSPGVAVRAQIP